MVSDFVVYQRKIIKDENTISVQSISVFQNQFPL